ncbi:GNAT family N-acetyltransferase [Pseudosulfitobacter sp. DSM 107133]|jgi:GNAT superfamily N-acetyltransferase|uniref:GNAT family N-acetyltransferase n=1 Tax=Pseudosulfitobacter sp. DSM 107133 TaxID=2883100 RepID=UPI000DF15BF7|nr:GNAT family N-acetyltransferase [Pseudosulfitobacter sp. DSM 107133]UOA28477.1 hypothetical protein DSM107133_03226 [Pseudosulfitobacter sp. DSM 107133]
MTTRLLTLSDYAQAAALLAHLSDGDPVADAKQFAGLLDHPGTSVFGTFVNETLACTVTLHILPNMTRAGRPYALIENVVTQPAMRGLGYANTTMHAATESAWAKNAYKIMLLTGQDTGARGFYEKLGFRADQKFGMQLRRLPPRRP